MGDPFSGRSMPCLEYTTKIIKRAESEKQASRNIIRLPITPEILLKLKVVWERGPISNDSLMIWAACTLALIGWTVHFYVRHRFRPPN